MQTQTITQVQVESLIESMRKAWSSFAQAVKRMLPLFLRAVRKASIAELESRSEYTELVFPIEKSYPWPVWTVDEVRSLKGYDKLISRLEGIQRKTRKPRIKKKLGKRISQLESKSLMTSARYLWGCQLDC